MREVTNLALSIIGNVESELLKSKLVMPEDELDNIYLILLNFIESKNPMAEYKHHM